MTDRQVRVVVTAVDKGASKSLTQVGDAGQKSGHRIGDAFTKVGELIGGEVGGAIQQASDKLEHFGKGNRITATGAALAGLGGVLTVMGSKEQAASQQLDQAITNSGHSVDAYGKRIDGTVSQMEHFGHSAVETKTALMTLTNATHDPAKALDLMSEAANLAAAKHISLTTASEQLARVVGGHGAKTLAAYNIALVKNANGTTNWDATNKKLAATLTGQASAASNTFSGHLKALRVEVEDNIASFGQKYGPAILVAGSAMTTLKPIIGGVGSALGSLKAAAVSSGDAITSSATAVKVAQAEVAAAEQAAADSANASAAEQAAAQDRVVAAHAAAAAAVAESDAGIAEADAAAGEASSLALGPIGLAVAGVVGVIGLATKGFGLFGSTAKQQIKPTDEFTSAIQRDNDALGANTRKVTENSIEKKGLYDAGLQLNISQKRVTDAAMGQGGALSYVRGQIKLATAAYDAHLAVLRKNNAESPRQVSDAMLQQGAYSDLTAEQKRNYDAAMKLNGGLGVIAKTLAVNKHAVDNLTAADGKVKQSFDATAGSAHYTVGKLSELAHAGHLTTDQLNTLIKQKRVNVNGAAAEATLRTIRAYLAGIQSKSVTVGITTFHNNGGGGTVSGSGKKLTAGGSDFFPGGLTSIAEREPEIVDLPRGSKVTPVSRLHGGGTTNVYNVNLSVMGDSKSAARILLAELQRLKGQGVQVKLG